jgi:hypothetical protein
MMRAKKNNPPHMMYDKIEVYIGHRPGMIDYDLLILKRPDPHSYTTELLQSNGEWVNLGPGQSYEKPTLSLTPFMLQEIVNKAAELKIKPEQSFLEGKNQAMEEHLKDMRALVFNKSPNLGE